MELDFRGEELVGKSRTDILLQAFEAAGTDAPYAPGLTTAEDIRTVCAAVTRPVNVVMGLKDASLSVAELAAER